MRRFLCVLLLFFAFAPPARADLILPGYRRISHELAIEPSDAWAGKRIVAAPVRGFGGFHEVQPGVPFGFSTKYHTRLYLVAAGEELPERPDEAWKDAHLSAAIPVMQISAVPVTSPLESVLTTLEVRALDATRFELAVADEDRRYDAKLAALLVALVLAGVGALVWLRRRRRRAA